MFCSVCGTQLKDDAIFCSNCGEAVNIEQGSSNNEQSYGSEPIYTENQGYGNQGYDNQAYGNQNYGNQAYDNQAYGNQNYGNQAYGNQAYGNQAYGNQSYGNQAYGNQNYGNQPYGNQGYMNNNYQSQNASGATNVIRSMCQNPLFLLLAVVVTIVCILGISNAEKSAMLTAGIFNNADLYDFFKVTNVVGNIVLIVGVCLLAAYGFNIMGSINAGITCIQIVAIYNVIYYIVAFFYLLVNLIDTGYFDFLFSELFFEMFFEYAFYSLYSIVILALVAIMFGRIFAMLKNAKDSANFNVISSCVGTFIPVCCFMLAFYYLWPYTFGIDEYVADMTFEAFIQIAACVLSGIVVLVYRQKVNGFFQNKFMNNNNFTNRL